MAKWIKFELCTKLKGRKTEKWNVETLEGKAIGVIQWFGSWRRYSFFPLSGTVYEQQCLRDIADFCEVETKRYKGSRLHRTMLKSTAGGLVLNRTGSR